MKGWTYVRTVLWESKFLGCIFYFLTHGAARERAPPWLLRSIHLLYILFTSFSFRFIRTNWWKCQSQLVGEILHLSDGKVREFQKPRAVATMRILNFETSIHSPHLGLQCTGQGSKRVLNSWKKKSWNLPRNFSDLEKVWKMEIKSGKVVKKSIFFSKLQQLAVFFSFWFNLARTFAPHHERSFVPAFFKVSIDRKKKLVFWKKVRKKSWILDQKCVRTPNVFVNEPISNNKQAVYHLIYDSFGSVYLKVDDIIYYVSTIWRRYINSYHKATT